ncbi:hypothetical protein RDI58_009133 [Solanum bulbocastanum]|uniref:Uncharacterized protein n=1 Tax=Solanum bulbocastanum TaxID=147425 RepID=A0AAN8TWB9_SOLBU
MVKKIEVNETSLFNGYNKHRLVLIPHPPGISYRYPQFTSYMINRPPSPNYHPAVCGIIEREKRRTSKGELTLQRRGLWNCKEGEDDPLDESILQ